MISDTGEGLPDGFSIKNEASLGVTLINSLSNQLGAEVDVQSTSEGTTTTFTYTGITFGSGTFLKFFGNYLLSLEFCYRPVLIFFLDEKMYI